MLKKYDYRNLMTEVNLLYFSEIALRNNKCEQEMQQSHTANQPTYDL